jgi:hypothetical protein
MSFRKVIKVSLKAGKKPWTDSTSVRKSPVAAKNLISGK